MKEFENKVAFITGAAHGQGRACALALAEEGADIAAFDVAKKIEYPAYEFGTSDELKSLKEEIEKLGRKCVICAGDVRDDASVTAAVEKTVSELGKIDILFNNAGICAYAEVDKMTDDEWNAADKSGISSKLWDIKQGGFTFGTDDNGKSDENLFSAIVIDLLNKSKLTNIFNFTENLNMANTEMKNRYKKDSVTPKTQADVTERMSAKSIKDYNDLIIKFKDAVILSIVLGADNYVPVKEVITEFSDYIGIQISRLSDSAYSAVRGNNFNTIAALADDLKSRYGASNSGSGTGGSGSGGSGGGGRGGSIKADNFAEVAVPEKMPTDIFVDLDSVEWAREAIVSLAEKRVVCGKEDKLFYPNDTITRYEFAKIVSNAFLADKSGDKEIPFVDVPKDFWAYEYVKTAYSNGVILGKSDDVFDGGAVITRQEMAAILYRAAQNAEKTLSDYESAKDYRFRDDAVIDDYAKEAVYVLRRDGVINGVGDDMFAPLDIATRAEAAQMVYLMQSL